MTMSIESRQTNKDQLEMKAARQHNALQLKITIKDKEVVAVDEAMQMSGAPLRTRLQTCLIDFESV